MPGVFFTRIARYLGAWTAIVALFAVQWYMHDAMYGNTWRVIDYVRWSMIEWYTWAALAPFAFWYASRHPIGWPLRLRVPAGHIVACAGFCLLAIIIGATLAHLFEPGKPPFSDQFRQYVSKHLAMDVLVYVLLATLAQASTLHRERLRREIDASRLQAELAQSRLQVLRMQLHPHFLFNTLHAASTLVRDDPEAAEDMLLRLSDLLRAYLDDPRQEAALADELEMIELYLGIQRARFKDRLTTHVDATSEAMSSAVPNLILQPVIENAIQHGIGKHAGPDRVELDCYRDDQRLILDVRNFSSTLEAGLPDRGIGLSNCRLRLQALYGDAAGIELAAMSEGGARCRLWLPFRPISASNAA